jgi:hypothetical protein
MVRAGLITFVAALVGCGPAGGGTGCGIAALAGPTMLLEEFTKPGSTLSTMPSTMPEVLPVRVVAGGAQRGLVGKTDTSWIIGVDGPLAADPAPGFGVLLVDRAAGPQGVLLYQGHPIPGAPKLGHVNLGEVNVPFIGLTTQAAGFQDPGCPLFPDSLKQ